MAKIEAVDVEIHQETDESKEGTVQTDSRPDTLREASGAQDFDETSPALMAQIREGYQEYLSGELDPIDGFMAELETELANE